MILNVSPATRTTVRNADPERCWQSVQWQMVLDPAHVTRLPDAVPVASVTAKIACALALIDPSNHRPAPI